MAQCEKITIRQNQGQSLMEIVIAMAIFALIAASLTSLILGSLSLSGEGGLITEADMLAQEGIEAVKAIKNRAWNELVYEESALAQANGEWVFAGEGTSEQIGRFSRVIRFYPVYRDSAGALAASDSADARLDIESRDVEVAVSWLTGRNTESTVAKRVFLSNWDANIWVQSDWSLGSGQEIYGEDGKYASDDGKIESANAGALSLKSVATSTYATTGYLISSAYFIGTNGAPSLISADWQKPEACSACEVKLQISSAPDNGGAPGAWTEYWCGSDGIDNDEDDYYSATSTGALIHLDHNSDRWFRYKLVLSGTETETPLVEEIRFDYKR